MMPTCPHFALLDDANGACRLFQQLRDCDHLPAAELDRLDDVLHQGWQRGWHALLWLPYEWGVALHGLEPDHTAMTVYWFGQQSLLSPSQAEAWLAAADDGAPAGIRHIGSDTDQAAYLAAVAQIQQAIARGDVYQINYTVRLQGESHGRPLALYRRLRARQPVPYGVLACLPDAGKLPVWTLGLSPELFLQFDADATLRTRPMKGTAPRSGHDGQDAAAAALRQDAKNRAENVMIVDLLRNDLGRVAVTGSVRVPQAFEVSAYGSVWQMTSTVEAQPRPGTRLADILRAAFPCGSITGAPKRMSMQLIRQLENGPRGLYTGSIGYVAPCRNALGFSGCLNVVIRTLQLTPQAGGGHRVCMGVGSGIVADSDARAEHRECGWKSRFVTDLPPSFRLIETMQVTDGRCALLAHHIDRLCRSAADWRFAADEGDIRRLLQAAVAAVPASGCWRLKVILQADGSWQAEHQPLALSDAPVTVLLHPDSRIATQVLQRYKTDYRPLHDLAWQTAVQHGAFDSLLFDEDGRLLEGGRSNVLLRIDGVWHTPAEHLSLLPGVMRSAVLAQPQRWLGCDAVRQSELDYQQVQAAEQLLLCNALRGLMPVAQRLAVALPA